MVNMPPYTREIKRSDLFNW